MIPALVLALSGLLLAASILRRRIHRRRVIARLTDWPPRPTPVAGEHGPSSTITALANPGTPRRQDGPKPYLLRRSA
jgi:hypothetical protein